MSKFFHQTLKNIPGWKTQRKIVVLSVDDYGNVRLASREAKEELLNSGIKLLNRFDAYDALETREDLESLFTVLSSYKDSNGNHPVFTAFAVPCNPDFERMTADGNTAYFYELLPQTYFKLSAQDQSSYDGAWQLWQEGISEGLIKPQFHGREHFNLRVLEEKLKARDWEIFTFLKNRSLLSIKSTGYESIGFTASFGFWDFNDNARFEEIIKDGLDAFEKIFNLRSVHFNAPRGDEHHSIHEFLFRKGIKYIDTPWIKKEHQGEGRYRTIINYTGKRNNLGMRFMVRNVLFEPTASYSVDWVSYAIKQIETAFLWHNPAIISSHRVNYAGLIDPQNRRKGLADLNGLLKNIIKKWPDVEFMTSDQLGELICNS